MKQVRSIAGIPAVLDFYSSGGDDTPVIVNNLTGTTYTLTSAGVVVAMGRGTGLGQSAAFGQVTVTFSGHDATIVVAVSAPTVMASSIIQLSITVGPGRDADELEMETFSLAPADIVEGVGFNVYVINNEETDGAEGDYLVNYSF